MLLRVLELLAVRRKRQGASGVWTAVALAAYLVRQYQRRSAREDISLREVLQPGESLLITHTTQPHG